ncbi:hypothetical protein QBC34DRAFT_460221 [Podospora aff. communis PSN243]|uniref:Uncharacterized protein n=1 Tax=Podospora aff. communis PSN243 TaxID=3040156 RepID=A0AAV9H5W3_9PEZI|nr:hypothetical protein QBC34DRAFT_460221 [Podospora aff. communis PSN243]
MSVDIAKLVETAPFRAAEDASWLATTCDTSVQADGTMEHYDQVVAVSQGMINHALALMHERIPGMDNFDGTNENGKGLISATLDPPKILIDTQDRNMVTWRTTFKEGSFVYKPENGDETAYPIDGWSVDTPVPLIMANWKDEPGDSPELLELKKKKRDWIDQTFQRAGDYRAERLYAKFADARWGGESFRFVGKTFIVDGKPIDYQVWKTLNMQNARVAMAFENVFKEICVLRQIQGLTTVGTKFSLDKPSEVGRPATYPPVTMIHQGFPYRMPPSSGAPATWANGVTSYVDPGSRNCLLYCENVEVRDMKQRMIGLDGNFATFGSANSKPETPSGRVEGTFSLSHQLFFERFLLPNLQAFVKATEVYPEEPTFTQISGLSNYRISQPYNIGAHGDKWPHPDALADIYKFKLVPDPNDATKMCYQATVPNSRDTPIKQNPTDSNSWNKLYSDGTPTVTVRWQSGGSRITIDAKCVYQENITTANHQTIDPGSHLLVPALHWSHVKQTITWGLTIDAKADKGDISFDLKISNPVKVEGSDDMNGWHWVIAGTTKTMQEGIESSVKTHMGTLEKALKDGFQGQLRFHYPGDGQLVFLKSMFNNRGDFIASIKYADMPEPDPKNRVVLPPPHTELPPPTHVDPSKGESTGTSVGGSPRLTWLSNSPVIASPPPPPPPPPPAPPAPPADGKPATTGSSSSSSGQPTPTTGTPTPTPTPPVDRRVTISITGTNTTTVPQYFSKISLNLSGNAKLADTLLRAAKFVLGMSSSQDEVAISVQASPDVTELSTALGLKARSAHMTACDVVLTPKNGVMIAVPPGGKITVLAKGVSGSKSARNYAVNVTEGWVNAQGVQTPGAVAEFKAQVAFQLQ